MGGSGTRSPSVERKLRNVVVEGLGLEWGD